MQNTNNQFIKSEVKSINNNQNSFNQFSGNFDNNPGNNCKKINNPSEHFNQSQSRNNNSQLNSSNNFFANNSQLPQKNMYSNEPPSAFGAAAGPPPGEPQNMGGYHKSPNQGGVGRPNHILLMSIQNQKYVITIEAIHKICSRFGPVVRIVMIRRRGTQTMVEFQDADTARRAMEELQNQDIYSGCCTLRVEYSKTQRLNVRKNDSNTWDFTVQPQLTVDATRTPLIQQGPGPYGGYGDGGPSGPNSHNSGNFGHFGNQHGGPGPNNGNHGHYEHHAGHGRRGEDRNPGPHGPAMTPVAIIYGLTDRVNCQHVFNLMCLHGNVHKVKFMKSKPGCAMVEFSDPGAVSRATRMTGAELFGSKLTIRPSNKSQFIGEPKGDVYTLMDKTPGFEDFMNSKFNRFTNSNSAQKNRQQEQRATVHFFNAPMDLTEERLEMIFTDEREEILHVKKAVIFGKKEGQKSSSGLVEFDSCAQAVSALTLFNHHAIDSTESSYPFNIKLCFATQDLS
jgi:heterogeneous nuclear ribonucleoprotein L